MNFDHENRTVTICDHIKKGDDILQKIESFTQFFERLKLSFRNLNNFEATRSEDRKPKKRFKTFDLLIKVVSVTLVSRSKLLSLFKTFELLVKV